MKCAGNYKKEKKTSKIQSLILNKDLNTELDLSADIKAYCS